jgi:hypothetical protein
VAHTQYPNWTIRSPRALDDLYWISTRAGIETDRPWVHGITQTVSWLVGRSPAPVSGRHDQPVTRPHVEAEKWHAIGYGDTLLPLAKIEAELGVEHLTPRTGLATGFVDGVWKTLRWVLGEADARVPLDIPQRLDDGTIPTAQQRYTDRLAVPGIRLLPEDRNALRLAYRREAAHDAILADIIEDTRQRMVN